MSIIQTKQEVNRRPIQWRELAFNGVLLGLWVWLYARLFGYLLVISGRSDFRFNQILLFMIIVLVGWQVYQRRGRIKWSAAPSLHYPAIAMMLLGATAFLLVERYIGINTFSASFCILASYGLLGLWMSPRVWRRSLPAAFLLVCILPFGQFLQTFIGFPMRIVTAEMVQHIFVTVGIPSITTTTVLTTVNGIANIDIPCSGVQSIWTGTMFMLAATWIERRKINLRWIGILLVLMCLLFIANFSRVLILTVLGPVLNGWQFAELLHVPLGVIGFMFACGGALALLKRQPTLDVESIKNDVPTPRWLAPILAIIVAGMVLVYEPFYQPTAVLEPIEWVFPATLNTEDLPLEDYQTAALLYDGAHSAERYTFDYNGLKGSVIFVSSHTWRGHHLPERCFEVAGYKPLAVESLLVAGSFPLRTATLKNTDQAAAFWFQSADKTTDDYAQRIWADFTLERDNWVLVSILFDDPVDHKSAEIQAFYTELHQVVGDLLVGATHGSPLP